MNRAKLKKLFEPQSSPKACSNKKLNDGTAAHTGSFEGKQVVKKVAVKRKLKDESKVKYDGSKEKMTTAESKRKKRKRGKENPSKSSASNKKTDEFSKTSKSSTQSSQGHLKDRLAAARFRYLNEMLYTSDSKEAMTLFNSDPSSYDVYHQGYRKQIEKWPVKPIDLAIKFVKSKPKHFVVADMGCGEAVLAASVPHKVYSFDMKALNERVTVADMANTPLQSGSVNIVVFCLSLMGTNITQFIQESRRVLAAEGVLWISEVSSRFNRDMKTFSDGVESIGFKCTSCNTDMTHFATLTFKKTQPKAVTGKQRKSKVADISLAPCLYKKR